jgi:ribosome-associated toxin RatA of RatAB toxin-antitoxin module
MTSVLNPLAASTNRLSQQEQAALRRKQPVITGEAGDYIGWILTDADLETAWAVLTDYDRFSQFLPSVVSSRVVEAAENRKVVEQVDRRRILLMNVQSKVQTENIEQAPHRIQFRLVKGDLKVLEGTWTAEAIDGDQADGLQVLVTQAVKAEANAGFLEGMFHKVFEASLKENLKAVQQEVERRSG